MAKRLTTNHERFGELSALALVGQVSQAEYQELRRHLATCAACREEYLDFGTILSTQLPLLSQQLSPVENKRAEISGSDVASVEIPESCLNPENLADLPLGNESRKPQGRKKLWPLLGRVPQLAAAACLGLLVVVIFLSFGIHQHAVRERSLVAALSTLKSEVAQLRGRIRSSEPVVTSAAPPPQDTGGKNRQGAESATRAALEVKLDASKIELRLLQNELEAARSHENEISARASEIQERLAKAGQELEAMTQERNQALATSRNQQQQLDALDLDLKAARDSVDRDRRLLAANRDIRDLMGARNLRIIDVFDVDGKGRTRRPFGRVFFTEGKSLVFYAFDLDREPALQTAAFQGWGSQGPHRSAVQSLGIFYRDDQTTNRWFLKFDDPQVLAEIDSVFVTIEPPGGSRRPTGARLLSAYLKADLNHP